METLLDPRFLIIFPVVLILIVGGFWLIRRLFGTRLGTGTTRGRQPRLAVIDAAAVDGRRRLVLIRRDNVEHLLMIGGPSDIVVESSIVRAVPVASQREAPGVRTAGQPEQAPRAGESVPAREVGPSWGPERPARSEPRIPEPAARLAEPARGEVAPPWMSEPSPRPPRVQEPLLADTRTRGQSPRVPLQPETAPPRLNPQPRAAAGSLSVAERESPAADARLAPSASETNLADMAQRLEAALRQPASGESARPQPVESVARPQPGSESAVPPGRGEATRSETLRASSEQPNAPRVDQGEAKPTTSEQKPNPPQPTTDAKPASPKNVLDSLEQEMASLLGRPVAKE
jgi:flagellar protein FliO/FliZ